MSEESTSIANKLEFGELRKDRLELIVNGKVVGFFSVSEGFIVLYNTAIDNVVKWGVDVRVTFNKVTKGGL